MITISLDPTSNTTVISNVHPLPTTHVYVSHHTVISTSDPGVPVPTIVVPVLENTAPLSVAVHDQLLCPYTGPIPSALAIPHTLSTIYPHTVVLLILNVLAKACV